MAGAIDKRLRAIAEIVDISIRFIANPIFMVQSKEHTANGYSLLNLFYLREDVVPPLERLDELLLERLDDELLLER